MKFFKCKFLVFCLILSNLLLIDIHDSYAFPIYAQQAYENPREATGRIVCANCHLAQKPVSIEMPKAILPNTVFEAIVKVPYDNTSQQILGNGQKGKLNIGAVLVLPKGFKLAPNNMLTEELRYKTKGIYIQSYSNKNDNILVVGPISDNKNQEITFPILAPDPKNDKNIHFIKYPVFVGANRGRGQIYPNGDKSNNNCINSPINGKIINIQNQEKEGYQVIIENNKQEKVIIHVPQALKLKVNVNDQVILDEALTYDPNVGGFGQNETEIVLQNPTRIKGMIGFLSLVTIAQIFFVLKKKQWEKVQAAEINF
jgi:apocytochrome f|uniref:Cytochrome f n=1 Tax=Thorea hispida TaxID=202687 RepID=A0A1C9CAA6_9FLOR|nr:cytochrome f [Thorea hispida]AOM65318.1 cytochrome f [Thorea hispida]UNJ79163.1 cytochrome f [Thorea hispida]